MPIRKRGDRPEDPECVRVISPKIKEVPKVEPSTAMIKAEKLPVFKYMKLTPGEDPLLDRRRNKRYKELMKSVSFATPMVKQMLQIAAWLLVQHEYWGAKARDLGPDTPAGMRATNEALKFLNQYSRMSITAIDVSNRFSKKAKKGDAPPSWIINTTGQEIESPGRDDDDDSEDEDDSE